MDKWISVDDEMPEKGENVLIFCGGDVTMIGWFDGSGWAENSEEIEAIGGNNGAYLRRTIIEEEFWKITHWMPLPDAPI